ncbi:MAG: sigma-70 family RNA polymerase sigma factor [Anaerolineae bacterium]|jgi:RNA polymerase sigma-70 factor (ECF subfamily)
MDEAAVIAAAQQGDVGAYNELVIAYQQLAFNVAYRVLGDEERAMDATQDAFLRGYRAIDSFNGGSFKAWILRITTNACYDMLRASKRRRTTSIDDLVEDDEHSGLLQDDQETPEEYVQRRDLNEVIQAALAALPEDQRTVVILSDIQGLNYAEIAEATMVSLGTVKSRLSRARAKMREYLLAHRELLPGGARLYAESIES